MMQEITLSKPLIINGEARKTLTYDVDEINALMFAEAESKKMTAGAGNKAGAFELDYSFHLYLGFAAIIALNPEIDYEDLKRIKGRDVLEVVKIGRGFITGKSEEESEESSSDEPSDSIQESTTRP